MRQGRRPKWPGSTDGRHEGNGAGLRFLPPYSPGFNPIEVAFSKIKAWLRNTAPRTVELLWDAIAEAIAAAYSFPGSFQASCHALNCGGLIR